MVEWSKQATENVPYANFEGRLYFWLAGFGSGDWDDGYPSPVSDVRLLEAVTCSREMGS